MLRAFFLAFLAAAANPALAQSWYNIEVLVFARNHASSEEIWPIHQQPRYGAHAITVGAPQANDQADPDALANGAWQPLSEDQTVLQYMMERMAGTGDYRQLYHKAWRQPIGSKDETLPVYLSGGRTLVTDDGDVPEMEGTLHFSESRYVHVDPRIWFNTQSDGQRFYVDIAESRRLTGHEVYYFDHPMFGMLVRLTR
ncbi:MAG: CsiV family protein [Pseudomonadota bacterium]|nr:CsiV family protein [Pseudomonadota bacterium]